jgi:4'-phosphopantetheinyl transferase
MSPFSLSGDEVHVWRIALDAEDPGAESLLAEEEKRRAARFLLEKDRRRWTRCRGALRKVLASYVGGDAARLRLAGDALGKPRLEPEGSLRFNLSHSEGLALVAVGLERPIGVDVERLRPVPDAPNIVASYFSASEKAAFAAMLPERREGGFLSMWTRKEAYLKARGEGLGRPLDEDPAPGWEVRELAPLAGFVGAVARQGRIAEVSLREWPPAYDRMSVPSWPAS